MIAAERFGVAQNGSRVTSFPKEHKTLFHLMRPNIDLLVMSVNQLFECYKPTPSCGLSHIQSTVWVAIPFAMVPRGRETIIRVQSARSKRPTLDPAEKCDDEKTPDDVETPADDPAPEPAEWNDVMTRDTNVEGQVRVNMAVAEHVLFILSGYSFLSSDCQTGLKSYDMMHAAESRGIASWLYDC
jgi:hypothetical protein